jgi:hypothetical protein
MRFLNLVFVLICCCAFKRPAVSTLRLVKCAASRIGKSPPNKEQYTAGQAGTYQYTGSKKYAASRVGKRAPDIEQYTAGKDVGGENQHTGSMKYAASRIGKRAPNNEQYIAEEDIGGIYQYTGSIEDVGSSGIPPQIASAMERAMGTRTTRPQSKQAQHTAARPQPDLIRTHPVSSHTTDELYELERDVGRKYGSKNFAPSRKAPQPQQTTVQRSWVHAFSNGKLQHSEHPSAGSSKRGWSTSTPPLFTGRASRTREQSEPPVNSQLQGFRLRPPPPVSVETVRKAAEKEAAVRRREAQQELKRHELREKNKRLFVPFVFKSAAWGSGTTNTVDDSVLADTTFEELGIDHPAVLANLRKMGLHSPTHIQAASIPSMLNAESVVLHAQTGSGKTLAYLLPLIAAVDPARKEVICVRVLI